LSQQVQRMAQLTAENVRLRELLGALSSYDTAMDSPVLVAELVGLAPDPFSHQIILDKGRSNGVYLGQPVLDANGLMGQVTEVGLFTSRALLITDASHAIPVQVNRNDVRAIAVGTNQLGLLELSSVPQTADIKVNDILLSSGLGGRFPRGYPVATVTKVLEKPGQPFLEVSARTTARLDRSRQVLLVFSRKTIE